MLQINWRNSKKAVKKKDIIKLKRIAKNWLDDIDRIPDNLPPQLQAQIFDTGRYLVILIESKAIGLARLSWLYDHSRKGLIDTTGVDVEIVGELTEVARICNKYLIIKSCFD